MVLRVLEEAAVNAPDARCRCPFESEGTNGRISGDADE
jgi:hypothetical protein